MSFRIIPRMGSSSCSRRTLLQHRAFSRNTSVGHSRRISAGFLPTAIIRFQSTQSASEEGSSDLLASFDDLRTSIQWRDGRQTKFHHQYLLDHCRCDTCFHSTTKQRLKSLLDCPPDARPASITADSAGIRVSWSSPAQHESYYPFTFLERASYDPPLGNTLQEEPILWNSKIARTPPTVTYESLMPCIAGKESAEKGVLRWLDKVHDFGFCFVSGVPANPEDTEELIRRIGTIRETHYGAFWDFTANMSHGDLAYSTEGLPAHTDTTYFTDPAGLQIFHLLSHPSPPGSGGTSLLVDGFYTASLLSSLYPSSYAALSRLRVPCHASGTPGTLLRPVINQPAFRHDEMGRLAQIRWNNEDRGILGQGWSPGDVHEWYQAARHYEELNRTEDAEYWVQLAPGTVVVIDNWRVMHGRASFTGSRRMCGAYIGADDWRSRRLHLRDKYEAKGVEGDLWKRGW